MDFHPRPLISPLCPLLTNVVISLSRSLLPICGSFQLHGQSGLKLSTSRRSKSCLSSFLPLATVNSRLGLALRLAVSPIPATSIAGCPYGHTRPPMRVQARLNYSPTIAFNMAIHGPSVDGALQPPSLPLFYDLTGDGDSEPEKTLVGVPHSLLLLPLWAQRDRIRALPLSES